MEESGEIIIASNNPLNIKEPRQLKAIKFILFCRFGGRKGYEAFLTQKKIIQAKADNAYDLERRKGKEELDFINALETADKIIEYKNMFQVLKKFVDKVDPESLENGVLIDEDKIKRLKDLSKEFSSDDMQEIVAGILAGEYNEPGKYCLQTISIVKNLSKNDLELFQKFGGLTVNGEFIFNNLFQLTNDSYFKLRDEGILYEDRLYLQDLGLFSNSDSVQNRGNKDVTGKVTYPFKIGNKGIIVEWEGLKQITDKKNLSKAGKEIFGLIEPSFNEKIFDIVKEELKKRGFNSI